LRLVIGTLAVLAAGPVLAADCPGEPVAAARACWQGEVEAADKGLAIQTERTSRALAAARVETLRQFEATIRNFRVFMETDCRVAGQMAAANGQDYEAARLRCTAIAIRDRAGILKGRL
jgi:tellurite resistance protein